MRKKTLLFGLICILLAVSALPALAAGVTLDVNDHVYFGAYKQAEKKTGSYPNYVPFYDNAPSPVLWQVKAMNGSDPILLSHFLIDCQKWTTTPLSGQLPVGSWKDKSTLREHLNSIAAGAFLENFSQKELDAMSTAFAASDTDTYVANDKVTLPSKAEMTDGGLLGFTGDPSRSADYRTACYPDNEYWLRSAGDLTYYPYAALVITDGNVYPLGINVDITLGVRPASQISLNLIIFKSVFDPSSAAAGGDFLNPFMLYCSGVDVADNEVHLSVNKDKLTVSFDQRAAYAYNDESIKDTPSSLAGKFTVMNGATPLSISGVAVTDGKIVLTLNHTFAYQEVASNLTVAYADCVVGTDTYGIGLLGTREYVESINSGSAIINAVTNVTPQPSSGGDDTTPTPPSPSAKSPDVRSVSVTIDGTAYEGTVSGDQITLNVPAGTDISKLNIAITGYPGATVTPKPPYDFSNGPVTITVKSPDGSKTQTYTITVNMAAPQPIPTNILNALASGCTAKLTQNADGTWGVEILIPFASGFTPAEIETIAAALSGLSGVKFYYVDETGAATEISTRKAGEKYLRITGMAASRAALSNVALTSVSIWKKNDAT